MLEAKYDEVKPQLYRGYIVVLVVFVVCVCGSYFCSCSSWALFWSITDPLTLLGWCAKSFLAAMSSTRSDDVCLCIVDFFSLKHSKHLKLDVSSMFQGCLLGSQGHHKGVSRVSQGFLNCVSRVSQGCIMGLSMLSHGCFMGDSRGFQGRFKGVSKVFQGSFKGD